jgi:hypothetical protein
MGHISLSVTFASVNIYFFLTKFNHNYLFISQLLHLLAILLGNISVSFASVDVYFIDSLYVDGTEPAGFCPLKRLTFSSSILKVEKCSYPFFTG